MADTKTIQALNKERRELARKIHALDEAIIALGGVPEPLNDISPSNKEVPVNEVAATPQEQPKKFAFFDRRLTEDSAYERYLIEIHDYDIRANWRKKVLFALNQIETKTGTVPEIVKVLMRFERFEDSVFKNVTWYASHMSRREKTIGVKKIHNRNHYFLKDQPPADTKQ